MSSRAGPFSLRQHMIRGAFGSLLLKITTTVMTLLMAVILARVLGVEGFGIYAFCLSIIQILTMPAMLGGQLLLVREVAAYRSLNKFNYLRGLILAFQGASLAASITLGLIAAAISIWIRPDSRILLPFLISLGLIPLLAAMQLQGAMLRGLRHVLLGQTAQAVRPLLVIACIVGLLWVNDNLLRPEAAVYAQLLSVGLLVLIFHFVLQQLIPLKARQVQPAYEKGKWIKSMFPFVLAGSMQILNKEMSVVFLGVIQSPEEVGLFRVAQRGALLIPFGLQAVNMAIAPTVSELFAKGDKQRLQRLISISMLAVLAFALPVALGLMLGGAWLIPLVFGIDYAGAYAPMVILCIGQLVNAAMGSVGLILNMVGQERLTAAAVVITAVVSMGLNLLLIPFWGAAGAALATSLSLALWNVLLAIWLYRKTGIVSTLRLRLSR